MKSMTKIMKCWFCSKQLTDAARIMTSDGYVIEVHQSCKSRAKRFLEKSILGVANPNEPDMTRCWLYEKGKPEDGEEIELTRTQYATLRNGYGDYFIVPLPIVEQKEAAK